MKWLKATPQARIEESIPERPLLHACVGNHRFGDITLDSDITVKPMVLGDVRRLPFKDNSFASAFMDCPWTASWKKNVADAMKELLRVAPIVYVLSPWTYGSSTCQIEEIYVGWQPGVNQTLAFIKYCRNNSKKRRSGDLNPVKKKDKH
jgi:hypothetical protein